jgi:hypothetical protein
MLKFLIKNLFKTKFLLDQLAMLAKQTCASKTNKDIAAMQKIRAAVFVSL